MNELKPCPFCGGEVQQTDCENVPHLNTFYCDRCPVEFSIPHQSPAESYVRLWNTRDPVTLPRVRAEDLVEGEWYLVKSQENGVAEYAIYDKSAVNPRLLFLWMAGYEEGFDAGELFAIYGPLPKFELEGK